MILAIAAAALLGASPKEAPDESWRCANQVEVWCALDGCRATPTDEMTPLDVSASADGAVSVCAYSGCWEGRALRSESDGRIIWTGEGFAFSTANDSETADVTLLILARDGVGFVRAGGLATPLTCERSRDFEGTR